MVLYEFAEDVAAILNHNDSKMSSAVDVDVTFESFI